MAPAAGIVTVRPFSLRDVDRAARFCEAARSLDPSIEPFGQRLGIIASGPRAQLPLWRVAEEGGELRGIAFAAAREELVFDFYAAVHPALRRQGLGRALSEAALRCGRTLRAPVRDGAAPGRIFLRELEFEERSAQLSLQWSGGGRRAKAMPLLRIRQGTPSDGEPLRRLSDHAWADAPERVSSRPGEIAQLLAEDERVVLVAESEGRPLAYLSAARLGPALAIEEIAVLPGFRRRGVGRALLAAALAGETAAVLAVDEGNLAARALYRSSGFRETSRRAIFERRR